MSEQASAGAARKLSDIELSDWAGERTELGTLWKDRPVVLVFLRHFG